MSLQTVRKERGDLEREKRFLAAHAASHDRIYRYFRRRTENEPPILHMGVTPLALVKPDP